MKAIDKVKIADFFMNDIEYTNVEEKRYVALKGVVDVLKAMEKHIYHSIYIIDYFKKNFLYMSNIMHCGLNPIHTEVGLGISESDLWEVSGSDKDIMLANYWKGLRFFNELPSEERCSYSLTYNCHMVCNGSVRMFKHCLTPIILTDNGKVWLALYTISLSSATDTDNVIMKKNGSSYYFQYVSVLKKWKQFHEPSLSDSELEMLLWSSQGHSIARIASEMCRSVDTVKAYRRSIFEKMDVKNITEALLYARNHQLI